MFDFLEIKREKFKLKNIKQFEFQGINHDDKMTFQMEIIILYE
jgi:hypothetical protein